MTEKEALKEIEHFCDAAEFTGDEVVVEPLSRELLGVLRYALKLRIPVNPLTDETYNRFTGQCPSCGAFFLNSSTKCCGNCGQALEWKKERDLDV